MFSSKRARTLIAMSGLAAGLGLWAPAPASAHEVPGPIAAANATAAAKVSSSGVLLRAKGIRSLVKPYRGVYCITFEDATLPVAGLTPIATLTATGYTPWGMAMVRTTPTVECGNSAGVLTVITGTARSGRRDLPFYLVVP
ncbi:hypothetical protein Aph01nite_46300 [Acrocarpospora phusangensis]|uniref:Uncharacterized protein n=1 Tax=Acrocarpospora phusangensis TaxID=1070424 RepID=A0A919QH08_9ACTN|nr:hypothetical protein [Acrocarpospora phusangensis]GIH26320.1 hypothetical protein Aph01nite_46300 [Acrocarpospora phusangensis]